MKNQLSHYQSKFQPQKIPIILIADNLTGEANIGSIFRLADAFNIEKIIFGGLKPNFESNRLKKTSRSTHKYVAYDFFEESLAAVQFYKEKSYRIFSLEITANSIPINELSLENDEPVALVIGNEISGVDEAILEISHKILHINMYGNNSSMNVAQATGIALYEMSKTILALRKK